MRERFSKPMVPSEQHNEIDARASKVAGDILAGRRESRSGRQELCELAMMSTIIDQCAKSAMWGRPQGGAFMEIQDLRDRYLDTLTTKIMGKEGVRGIDLERIAAGDSFCGFLFHLLSGSTRFHRLRHMREYNTRGRFETPMQPSTDESAMGIDYLRGSWLNTDGELFADSHSDPEADLRARAAMEGLMADRPALRGDTLLIRQARTACRGLGLRAPVPVPWQRQHVRDRVGALLERTNDAELVMILEALSTGVYPAPGAARQFAMMWSEHSVSELERVCGFGGSVVRLLTRAAITPVPKPRSSSVTMLSDRACELAQRSPRMVSRVVSAWADARQEMTGSEWGKDVPRPRTAEEMAQNRAVFDSVVAMMLHEEVEALGRTPDEVFEFLVTLFDEVEEQRLDKREAEVLQSLAE